MIRPPPRLLIRTPSPTTIEFTVTNSRPPSLTTTLLTTTLLLLRLLLLLLLTLTLVSRLSPTLLRTPLPPYPAHYFYPVHAALTYLALQRLDTSESLLVMGSLGVQTSTTAGTLWGQSSRSRFIPTDRCSDMFLLEGFWGWQVRYYMAVAVDGEGGLVVVFPTLLPGREMLETVWRGARRCL